MRNWTTCTLFAASLGMGLGYCGVAQAQYLASPLGLKGQVTFGAERLFGFSWVHDSWNDPGPGGEGSGSATVFGLGWWYAQPPPMSQPRAGVDYFFADRLSLGGALGFFSGSSHDGVGYGYDGFLFAPRFGYAVDVSPSISFWPRGGLTYINVNNSSFFGLTAEGNIAIFPTPNWAFLITPAFDAMPFGSYDTGGPDDGSQSAFGFGISVGLLGVL